MAGVVVTLLERITQALNGTPSLPWKLDDWNASDVVDADDLVRADCPTDEDARLIAAAPGLLAECAQRLTTDVKVAELVGSIRYVLPYVGSLTMQRDLERAAALLEQVFLDPQETT